MVSRSSFGCLPIQRRSTAEAVSLLRRAYEHGINFFDTARLYTDSEQKVGIALKDVLDEVVIATKSMSSTGEELTRDLEESLKELGTDHIDLFQLHNPPFVPVPGGEDGLYDAMYDAKQKGLIGHIGITNHSLKNAKEAAASGFYETVQFPFSSLSGKQDVELVDLCRQEDVGFIAMKALSGGLIRDIRANFSYLYSFGNVVPIWGFEKEWELEEILALDSDCPDYDDVMADAVLRERASLGGDFCRGCGYCMPCPEGINISFGGRMESFLRRMVFDDYMQQQWALAMEKIPTCTECGSCVPRCPYGLVPYELIRRQYEAVKDREIPLEGGQL